MRKALPRLRRPLPLAREGNGEGGIRTLGTVAGTPVFETGTFGRSVTSPYCGFPLGG